jgi:glycerol-3-phosphate acyltransferase PlsY
MLNTTLFLAIGLVIGTYFIGSIPTGYIVAKQMMGIDIREHGSGNVGATNVKRVVGNKAGLIVLICDFFKGLVPVAIARILVPDIPELHIAVAFAAIIGHSRSIFLNFTGGKSAITGLGTLMALEPVSSLLIGLIAFITIKLTRFVSVGSMVAAIFTPIIFILMQKPLPYILYALTAAIFVIYLHRGNIGRLRQGTENKI